MPRLSIVIPVYNEANTLRELIRRVEGVDLGGIQKEIILVDDGSTDHTREILLEYRGRHRVILRPRNGGKGAALKDGFRAALGDYLIIQDADLEYDPADYAVLLGPVITDGAEVVFGSRTLLQNNTPFSQVYFYGGLLLTKIFNLLFGARLTDFATCYKLFPVRFVPDLLRLPGHDFVFDVVELTHYLVTHAEIKEVPIHYAARSREAGKKINWRHGLRCFFRMLQLRVQ